MPTQVSKNGHEQYPYEFICKDSGIVLRYRKVPFTVTAQLHNEYEKQHPQPKPPTQEIDYGDKEKIQEPNYSHPSYLRLLKEWNDAKVTWVNERAMHVFSEYAIECGVDNERVAQLRKAMGETILDGDNKFVYIWNIAVGTGEGYGELFAAIQRRSQVTEQAVSETLARFPNPISE